MKNRLAAVSVAALVMLPMCGPRERTTYEGTCVVMGDPGSGWTWRQTTGDIADSRRATEASAKAKLLGRSGWTTAADGNSVVARNAAGAEVRFRISCSSLEVE